MFILKLESFFEKEDNGNAVDIESKSYLDKNFISEVSNYVYDMRTVINICNEFKLYNEILIIDKPNIDKNKLFAIIFYKNIFPDDFARIQKNESKLHRIFKKDFKKDKGLEKIILGIEDQLKTKIEEKNELEKILGTQVLRDINELRNIYIFNLMMLIDEKHQQKIIDIEEMKLSDDLSTDENFEKIKESSNIKFSYDYIRNHKSGISFKDVENKVNNELTYNKREKLIKDFHENKIALLERKIIHLNNEKQNIKNLSLLELYQNYNEGIDLFLDLVYSSVIHKKNGDEEVIENKLNPNISLFKYLFKNDYVNEDFIEYVSYFHPGSLSANDHKLMMKINQNELTSFEEKIEDVENLVKSVIDIRFKNQSILIYDIFEFLLKDCQNPNLRNEKLDFVLDQIQNYNNKSVYFIEGFLRKISNDNFILSNFYVEITKWDKFWNLVETKFSEDLKRIILFDLIQLFSDEVGNRTLIQLNKNKGLTNFINLDKDLLKDMFERISVDSFIKTLVLLKVQFNLITPDEKINGLLSKIYENNLYQINIDNLSLFSQFDPIYDYDINEFYNSNFSFLKSKIYTHLYKRISQNLNQYIENVYLINEHNINEKPDEVLYLLEQEDTVINLENKIEIIKKGFRDKLENFGSIQQKEIIVSLIDENKIFSSWKNIAVYYDWEGPFTSILTNYLNKEENYSSLSIVELYENFDDFFDDKESCIDFIYNILNDENLLEDSFEIIFKQSGTISLESSKITFESRISFLIEKDFLVLDEEEFESLFKKNKDLLIKLIEKNENIFVSELDIYNFDIEFLENLLNSKLKKESLKMIINEYENKIIQLKDPNILTSLAKFYIDSKSQDLSPEIFDKLIFSPLSDGYKIKLFNLYFSDKDRDNQIGDFLENMKDEFADGIINRREISFDINEENKYFLNMLKEEGLIASFRKDNKKGIFNIYYS